MSEGRRNPPAEELYARKWPIFAVTMIGLFMALMDLTVVNITIPELQRELDADVNTVSWVLNAYNIVFAVLLVSMGRLADQFGRKRFFIIGMSIFTVGSLLCAIAWSIDALIAFRGLQAIGAGVLAPIALANVTMIFPPEQRGLGLGLMAVIANLAAAIGPPLGGVLVEFASWHWIFAINVPIGIAGVLLAWRLMPQTYDLGAGRQVDWIGMVLIGAAVFCLSYGLVEANERGWGDAVIVGLLATSALLTLAFALSQRYGRFPMLTSRLVRNGQFMGACGAFVLFGIAVMGMLFLAVIAFVDLWKYSQLDAALAITPIALLGLVVAPVAGRAFDRVPPRLVAIPALVLLAVGLAWFSAMPTQPDYLAVLPSLCLVGVAMGALFPAISVGAMGSVPGQELGLASGLVNMSRQLGFTLGVAVLVAVFTGELEGVADAAGARAAAEGARDAFGSAMRVAALAAVLAIPLALTLRERPRAPVADAG